MHSLDEFRLINLTCDAFTIVLMVVLLLGLRAGGRSRKRGLLRQAIRLHLVTMLLDFSAWFLVGTLGMAASIGTNLCAYLTALFGVLGGVTITLYMSVDSSGEWIRTPVTDRLLMGVFVIIAVNLLILLTNPWTHLYFQTLPSNEFVWGPWFNVYDLLTFMQVMLMVPMVIYNRERYGSAATLRILGCGVLIGAGMVCDSIWRGLVLLNPAVGLGLVLLSVGVQARLEEDLVRLRAESAESRVRLLTGQIRPHFLFNSLTVIKALVSEDPEAAERAIQDFSDYLRSHLDVMSTTRLVPFEQELDHVRHYVSLELTDATTPLEVSYDLQTTDFSLPPLTVQPLVENAIRHGAKMREGGGSVKVATRRVDGAVHVTVSDNGEGFSSVTERQSETRRVGIQNVRERIERQCGGSLIVQSGGTGAVVTLVIPEGE